MVNENIWTFIPMTDKTRRNLTVRATKEEIEIWCKIQTQLQIADFAIKNEHQNYIVRIDAQKDGEIVDNLF